MSHFVVLVIGDDVEKQLQPYHEYECTGINDEYVVDVDVTDEVEAQFAKPQTVVKLRDGSVFSRWDQSLYTKVPDEVLAATNDLKVLTDKRDFIIALSDQLDAAETLDVASGLLGKIQEACGDVEATKYFRDLTAMIDDAEKSVRRASLFASNQFELPEGAVEAELTADQARVHGLGYETLAQCAEEYYGSATEKDGRFYRHTNADKWEWIDSKGNIIGRTIGDETLPGLRPSQKTGEFLAVEEGSSRAFYILHPLRDGEKFATNYGDSPQVASERDLQSDTGGSLSQNRTRSRSAMFGMQSDDREGAGQYFNSDGSYRVSFPVYKEFVGGKKWDWWVIGGRWTGWYVMKPGRSGTLGKASWGSEEPIPAGTADQFLKGDVDFEAMRTQAGEKAGAVWDKAHAIIGNETWLTWEDVRTQHEKDGLKMDKARDFYHGQPALRALRESGDEAFKWQVDDNLVKSRDEYVQRARDSECIPYAVVHEGKWIGKGEMGWWGISIGDEKQENWNAKVSQFLDQLPDDTQITVVDAHI